MAQLGPRAFDVVISTEMLEHIPDWRAAVTNLKGVCRLGGLILITTRAPGFPLHGAPHDYWRYTVDDIREIFSDMTIVAIESDPQFPGVFMLARANEGTGSADLGAVHLLSSITGRRELEVPWSSLKSLRFRTKLGMVKIRDIVLFLAREKAGA